MKTNESGRSLIETLSTLVIMGILGVAGVVAYNSAMNRYRANTLISEAQRRAVVVAGQIGFNNQEPSLTEFEPYNKTSAGEFGKVTTEGLYKQFGIQVSGVTKSVCQNILNTIGENTPIRRLSKADTPTTPITFCDEGNTFLFIYNNDMTADDKVESPHSCRTVNDCKTICATCEIPEDEEVGICTNECEEPIKLCQADTDCKVDNECNVCDTESGLCKNDCERVEYLESTGTQYIDTGVIGTNENMGIDISWAFSNNNASMCIFSSRSAQISNTLTLFWLKNTNRMRFDAVAQKTFTGEVNASVSGDIFNFNYKSSTGAIATLTNKTTGQIQTLYISKLETFSTNPLYLFASRDTAVLYSWIKMYNCQIYDNNILVRDFIPVLSPKTSQYAGQPCMFDKVTKELFCNAGSGTFEYGLK